MRIRKRFRNLITPPDLSSPPPAPSAGAAPVAVSVAAGGKHGEAIEATGGKLSGPGGGSGAGGGSAVGGSGLHLNGDLPAEPFHGCTTKPISFLHFRPPPPEAAAAAEGEGRGDLPAKGHLFLSKDVPFAGVHRAEVPTRKQDGDQKGGDVDAHRRWNASAHGGATAAAPKSLGAEVPGPSLGHSGCIKTLSNVMPKEEADTAKCSDEERRFPLKTRRWCYRAQGVRAGDEEEEEEHVGAERDMKPRRRNTRRRRAGASINTAKAPTGIARTSASNISNRGAQAATGAEAWAAKRDDMVVKAEEADVTPAAAAALAEGNRVGGNGKKRRSPSVLMEGSRCSRVNGRGWRCCQQTLVGYSLCEHHLGKGRLRSVSSVRCNGRAKKKEEVDEEALSRLPSPLQQKQQQEILLLGGGLDGEEENLKVRRKKIGMVKARSISSLLHQPDYSAPTAMAAPEPSPSSYSASDTGII